MTSTPRRRAPLTERGDARRLQVIETAARLFQLRGYHNVSMYDIAQDAGLAKPTLYHYFHSKSEILYEIHQEFISPLLTLVNERAETELSASEELRMIVLDVLTLFARKPAHLRVFVENLRELEGEPRRKVLDDRKSYGAHIERIIAKGVASNEFGVDNPRLAALTFVGALNWSYQWYRPDGPSSAVEIAEELWRTLVFGLIGTTKPGPNDVIQS